MTLVNPRAGYIATRDAIITLLQNSRTTYLNTNLTKTFDDNTNIKKGNPLVTPAYDFPSLWVSIPSVKTEDFDSIGGGARKALVITFNVYPIVRILNGNSQDDDDELANLVDNVEAVFRDNIEITADICLSNLPTTDFFYTVDEEDTYASCANIQVEIELEVE